MSFKDDKILDLDVFVDPEEFGVIATLNEAGVDKIINVTVRSQPDDLRGLDVQMTIICYKKSDAPRLSKKSTFILEDKTFRVVNMPENFDTEDYPKITVTEVD